MSVKRRVCIEYTNKQGESKQFFQDDVVAIFTDDEMLVGRIITIWVDYLTMDCSMNFDAEVRHVILSKINEVISYDDYKQIQPLI